MELFTNWLLETEVASIRYFTLRHLLGRREEDGEVAAARSAIMHEGLVPIMLARQTGQGKWQGEHSFYTPKYVSTHWSMLLMTEYGADQNDTRLQRGVDFMLGDSEKLVVERSSPERQDWVCLFGNILRYAIYFGRGEDPRLAKLIHMLVLAAQERDWRCHYNGDLPCAWGALRSLWGLAALPPHLRTPEVEKAIQSGVKFIYGGEFALHEGSYPTPGSAHEVWSKLNFPLFYQSDVLFALRVAADLNVLKMPAVETALQWLLGRRQENGRWRGASPFGSRTWRGMRDSTETSRWVSLQAAMVLKAAGLWEAGG